MSPRPRRRLFRVLALAGGFGAALLLAEATVRALGLPNIGRLFISAQHFTDELIPDPVRFWRLSTRHPECNAEGLRGPWWEETKAANELRILAVGDSCTFGSSVSWESTWGVQLERLLQARHRDRVVRTGLAALPGYSTFQNRRLLDQVLVRSQPDVVVFYCGAWNDSVPAVGANDLEREHQLEGSRLWLMLRLASLPSGDEFRAMLDRGEVPYGRRVPLATFDTLLGEMVAASRAIGARVVTIVPSHPASTTAKWPIAAEYRERVRSVARRENAAVVDLADVVRRLDPTDAPRVPVWTTACFVDWVHPAPNLHEALAHAVAEAIDPAVATPPLPPPSPAGLPITVAPEGEFFVPDATGPLHRAWVGVRPLETRIVGDRLGAFVPNGLPPGEHVVQIVDRAGVRDVGIVVVPAKPLQFERNESTLQFTGRGRPDDLVMLWTSLDTASDVTTPWGGFSLVVPGVRRPIAGMHRIDLAADDRYDTKVAADGTWTILVPVGSRVRFAQALVLDSKTFAGAFTSVATLRER